MADWDDIGKILGLTSINENVYEINNPYKFRFYDELSLLSYNYIEIINSSGENQIGICLSNHDPRIFKGLYKKHIQELRKEKISRLVKEI